MISMATHTDKHDDTADTADTATPKSYLGRTHKIALCGILIACALVLSYVESLLPLPVPASGIKLGIANAVALMALYRLGGRYAFAINICRVMLAGAMFAGFSAMLYGLAGGILSVAVMILAKRTGVFSVIGVSIAGASAHIIGQIILASAVIQSTVLLTALPLLLLSAVISGTFIGYLAHLILAKLPKSVHLPVTRL
jgi:heptaprenyl diphosphate synthase